VCIRSGDDDSDASDDDGDNDTPVVSRKRAAPVTTTATTVTATANPVAKRKRVQTFEKNDEVEVLFGGKWYTAVITFVHDSKKGGYKVLYHAENTFEPNVPARRIRHI